MTIVTGLLIARLCHDPHLTLMFSGLCKNICLMESGVKLFQTKLLSRLSHKVCRLLSSPILLRKFSNIIIAKNRILQPFTHAVYLLVFSTIDSVFREDKVPRGLKKVLKNSLPLS